MTNKTVHNPCPYVNDDCPVCKNKEYTDEKLLEVYQPLNRDTYEKPNNPLITKIRESEEVFENKYPNIDSGIDNYGTFCDIRSFHHSSLISLLEENIVRLKEKRKENKIHGEFRDWETHHTYYGFNEAIDQEITFYQQTIDELRK